MQSRLFSDARISCRSKRRGDPRAGAAVWSVLCLLASVLAGVAVLAGHPVSARAATGSGGFFHAASGRLLDTRNGGGPYAGGSWHTVSPNGQFGIPTSGVTALAVEITSTGSTYGGVLTVLPASAAQNTLTSQLNWNTGETVSNTALVATDGNGAFQVHVSAATQLIVDLQGYFTQGSGSAAGGFVPLPNGGSRITDTRSGSGGALSANSTITVSGATAGDGVPSGATALFVNITVLSYDPSGCYVTPFATGAARPATSLDYLGNQITALGSTVAVNSAGQFNLYVGPCAGKPIDVVIDVQGYYTGSATAGAFTPQAARVYDSRSVARLQPGSLTKIQVANLGGIPAVSSGLAAEVINAEVVSYSSADDGSFLRMWGTNQAEPNTSDLNINAGATRSNLATVVPGSDNSIYVRYHQTANATPIDLILDAEGWYAPTAGVPGPPQGVSATGSNGTATISFSPPASDGGAAITGYTVIASPNGKTATGTGSPITITGLSTTTTYTFTVTATNAAGTGPASAASNPVTPGPPAPSPPGAPQNVHATPGNASASVSFDAPASDGGATITKYTVTSSPGGIMATGAGSPITVTGLTNQTAYTFTVTATNSAGTGPASAPSTPVTPMPQPATSCYDPNNHCWGVDVLPAQTQSDLDSLKNTLGDGSYPDFVGRYITRNANPAPLQPSEVALYRTNHIALELLADETGGCADQATGLKEADDAVTALKNLGLGSGTPVAILLDEDEPNVAKTAACESAYADELVKLGYQPGFYLNPGNDSGAAYCGAIGDSNVANAVVWSDEPEPTASTYDRNSSPAFNPQHPACGSGTTGYGWQYAQGVIDSGNNEPYDLDEIAPDRTSSLWTP